MRAPVFQFARRGLLAIIPDNLAFSPGTRLGPYEVVAQIGVGGMGEVYRATDTNLARQVAIKVLPEAVASDADRLARFDREAKILAALNHPNIAAVYGLERSGAMTALVMELVEGPTLADRIAQGAIPIDEALPIAKQICEALEAAHEQGIIHRDLKPANIKVRPDGTVKVLDFGLAKAMEPTGVMSPNASMSPTITSPAMMTGVGMILGTAAYMSPEQARGKTVDKRADIWAFGCVLFEMLTGKRSFAADDVSETLVAVLRDEPAWSSLPLGTPREIRTLLRRSLQKDRTRRIHSAADARLEIEDGLAAPAADSSGTNVRRGVGGWVVAAVFAVALLALAIPAVVHLREASPAIAPETRTEISTPASNDPLSFALSPDGKQLVFVASGDGPSRLWLRPLAVTTAQPLQGTEGATAPFWSPDSRSVGFFADSKLKRLDIGGGSPLVLANSATSRGGTWNADGVILFAPFTAGPLFRVPASGGEPVAVTKLDLSLHVRHRQPQFLPDGRQFLFHAQGTPETTGIYIGSLDSNDTTRLTSADTAGTYAPGEWLLWLRDGTLVAQRLDPMRRALTGDLVTLANSVGFDVGTSTSALSLSAAGMMAYRPGGASRRQLRWFDRSGKPLGALGAPDETGLATPRLGADGRVAVARAVQGNTDVWLLDGSRTSRLTFDATLDRFPVWSPDGTRIVFDSNRTGMRNLYVKPSSGVGSEDLLLDSQQVKTPNDWSPDGRWLIYMSQDPQTAFDLWVMPLDGDRKPWLFLKTNFVERNAQFSPDGRWVAYASDESGRFEVYVRPFITPGQGGGAAGAINDAADGQWQVSTAGGLYPRWRSDGRELYYIGPNGQMMAAPVSVTGTTLAPGSPVVLFQTGIVGGGVENGQGRQYDVTRDGRFLINTVVEDAAAPITLIQNWQGGLSAREK